MHPYITILQITVDFISYHLKRIFFLFTLKGSDDIVSSNFNDNLCYKYRIFVLIALQVLAVFRGYNCIIALNTGHWSSLHDTAPLLPSSSDIVFSYR